jgi:hypothetical protein
MIRTCDRYRTVERSLGSSLLSSEVPAIQLVQRGRRKAGSDYRHMLVPTDRQDCCNSSDRRRCA